VCYAIRLVSVYNPKLYQVIRVYPLSHLPFRPITGGLNTPQCGDSLSLMSL